MMLRPRLALPLVLLLLGACATVPTARQPAPPSGQPQSSGPGSVRITPPRSATPPTAPAAVPGVEVMNIPGLETVIGATASQLGAQFGQPALDVAEGQARKLQYRSEACVLEFYLYPGQSGEKVTTWVEARRTSDGLDVDRAACVSVFQYANR